MVKILAAADNSFKSNHLLRSQYLETKFKEMQPKTKKENNTVVNALSRLLLNFESVPSMKLVLSNLLEQERRFAPKLFYAAIKRVSKLKSNKAIFAVEFANKADGSSPVSFGQYLRSLYW